MRWVRKHAIELAEMHGWVVYGHTGAGTHLMRRGRDGRAYRICVGMFGNVRPYNV